MSILLKHFQFQNLIYHSQQKLQIVLLICVQTNFEKNIQY